MYTWTLVFIVGVVLTAIILGVYAFQGHERRKKMEQRGYRLPDDPDVDPRSANEP